MTTNKALNKLTYYDFLSDLLPGIPILWALPAVKPVRSGFTIGSPLTGNILIDLIVFIALSHRDLFL